MRQNSRITGRRICAAVALVVVTAWGIPAVAPAALASPAVASAATRSAPSRVRPLDADLCVAVLTKAEYTVTPGMRLACTAGATTYPGDPHISLGIALSLCFGGLLWAKVDHVVAFVACLAANPLAYLESTEWCSGSIGNDCLNAWGGGPWVDVYTGGPETGDTHQEFTVIDEDNNALDNSEIMFTGSGSWSGECIGDAYNNSGYADTSLDPCALPGQNAGWGTQMLWGDSGCPAGEAWFYDIHWNGYLGPPAGGVNGSHWYLNKPSPTCFAFVTET